LREINATATLAAGCLMLFVPAVLAQPQFEVASIKPVDRADVPKSINFRGGGLKATNCSLKDLNQMLGCRQFSGYRGQDGWNPRNTMLKQSRKPW
jgi:hypothetical protein